MENIGQVLKRGCCGRQTKILIGEINRLRQHITGLKENNHNDCKGRRNAREFIQYKGLIQEYYKWIGDKNGYKKANYE